ncbi:hypothetical protein GF352_02855 [archaeon]|nr:hypothetical protein [archaeon]
MFSVKYAKELLVKKLLTRKKSYKILNEINKLDDYEPILMLWDRIQEYGVYKVITNKMLKKEHLTELNLKFNNIKLRDPYITLLLNGGQNHEDLARRIKKELNNH